jgi:carboxypeptidase C (cathepsin A)
MTTMLMLAEVPSCVKAIEACQSDTAECPIAQQLCNEAQLGPYEASGLNVYDLRIKCAVPGLCYDFSAPMAWLNLASTRAALGVTKASAKWDLCNMRVNQMFAADWMKSQEQTIPPLLAAGVRVLIYAGACPPAPSPIPRALLPNLLLSTPRPPLPYSVITV